MTDFNDNRIALVDTDWTRMQIRSNEIMQAFGESFVRLANSVVAFNRTWGPVMSDLHRMQTRRIHSDYRRRQKARRRR